MTDYLSRAKAFRETVLLAELGAWLHDLGKLSQGFVESKTDLAYGEEEEETTFQSAATTEGKPNPCPEQVQKQACSESPEVKWVHGCVLKYDHDATGKPLTDHLNEWLAQSRVTPLGDLTLSLLVSAHHPKSKKKHLPHILALLIEADRNDSGEDEYNAAGLSQSRPVQRATVFGLEDELDLAPLDALRQSLYAPLEALVTASPYDRDEAWQLLRAALNNGLGKTQRAANDIRLDQHVWGVASRFKAFVMRDLLDPPATGEIRNTFCLLTVQWNAWEAITPFARLSDVAGRMAMIARVRDALRKTIETEYAIGNRIYEDDDGIHFLVADLEWGTELEALTRGIVNHESGGELLPEVALSGPTARVTDLARQMAELRKRLPIVGEPEWLEDWKATGAAELCPVCRRRPSPGDGALCDWCVEQRRKGAEKRRERSGIRQDEKQTNEPPAEAQAEPPQLAGTLQTGELADERGKTALIVARFDLDDWLKGDLLHTLFITSPQDMATVPGDPKEAMKAMPVPVANWRELSEAIAQIPVDFLQPLADTDGQKIKEQEDKLRNWGKQRKGTPGGQLARWLTAQFGRLQSIVETAQLIQNGDGVTLQGAFLLALARKNPSAARLLRVWQTTKEFLQARADALAGDVDSKRQYAVLTLYGKVPPEGYYYTAELPGLGEMDVLVRANDKVQTASYVKDEQIQRLKAAARDGAPLRWLSSAVATGEATVVKVDVDSMRQRAVLTLESKPTQDGYCTVELPVLGTVEVLVRADGRVQTTTFARPEQMARFQEIARGAPLRWVAAETTAPADTVKIRDVLVESYAPYQVITVSPNLLLAMVPADRALAIAQDMQAAYAEEFSKVQGRLPFHVGLAFMDAHYPMFAALDTARRLAETFDTLGNQWNQWMEAQVAAKTPETPEAESYTLQLNSERFGTWDWTISARLGNGAPDWYHPYVLVKTGADLEQRGMRLLGPQGRWVHISQVQAGDTIRFLPNLFDFISLDTVSRRLEAHLDPEIRDRRPHTLLGTQHSPRPYLLERVNNLAEVWQALCAVPGMSESRLQAATTLLARKWEDWQLSDHDMHRGEYHWLVEKTVNRDFAGNGVIQQAIKDGLYFDVIDLYRHILKQPIQKPEKQTPEKETA